MRITGIREIEPKLSRCIEVKDDERLFEAKNSKGNTVVTHNSVVQRNIIVSTIIRGITKNSWRFVGIDLKRVELSFYRKYTGAVLGIATTLDDALAVLQWAQQTMMSRYTAMEELGYNNFIDVPGHNQKILIMIDELGELLSMSGVKALSENTPIPLAGGGFKRMGDLEAGKDTILDNYSNPAQIVQKYEPLRQDKYEMRITSDTSGKSEDFIAGAEHDWIVRLQYPNGEIGEPQKWSTERISEFLQFQAGLAENEQIKLKIKRDA